MEHNLRNERQSETNKLQFYVKIAHASRQIVGQNWKAKNGEAGRNESAKEGWNAASIDAPDSFRDETSVGDDERAADENDL